MTQTLYKMVNGEVVPLTQEEIDLREAEEAEWQSKAADRLKESLAFEVQAHLDSRAREHTYDNIFTAVTYADEDSVPRFQMEGRAFRAWRSQVWARCYELLAEVEAGIRPIPTAQELIDLLPHLELPE